MKIFLIGLTICCLVVGALAGDKTQRQLQPMLIDLESSQAPAAVSYQSPGTPFSPAGMLNFVALDTMPNAFGPASRGIKPMAYDSASGVLATIYRGATSYSAGSGELWYSISRDDAATWRRVAALNNIVPILARYPSCAISNPTNSSDTSDVLLVYAAPQLVNGAFGFAVYGADFAIGTGNSYAVETAGGDSSLWSNLPIWTADGSTDVVWACYRRATVIHDDLWRWRTNDFITVEDGQPSTWTVGSFTCPTCPSGNFGLDIGGEERNGTHYMGKWGPFTGDDNLVDNFGYSTSTDGGVTWSGWTRPLPDWRYINGLDTTLDVWTYGGPGAYSNEMFIDANNRVHFIFVAIDINTNERSIVEIFETGSGWDSKIITTDLKESTALNYPGTAGDLNQMGNHLNGSTNVSGEVMSLVWLDAATQGETFTDIWFSFRKIGDASWSTPVNLTQTPAEAELLLHAPPTLKTNGPNDFTMFIGKSYDATTSAYPPESGNPTVFYAAAHQFSTVTSVREVGGLPDGFALEQNYPNPFNPTTNIRYSIPNSSFVTLKVYDMLGKEVATLMDGEQTAGSYVADFDAAALANGVYVYRLQAGSFSSAKKMVVLK